MVDASIRGRQIPAEEKKREEAWAKVEEWAMTPVLWGGIELWLVSRQSFWTFLDQTLKALVRAAGAVWGFRRGVMDRVMKIGIFQECWMGLFRGGLFNGGRCSPRGNHKIIIPSLLTYVPPTHTLKPIHTHIPEERSRLWDHQGGNLKGIDPPAGGHGYLQPLQMVLFTFY